MPFIAGFSLDVMLNTEEGATNTVTFVIQFTSAILEQGLKIFFLAQLVNAAPSRGS